MLLVTSFVTRHTNKLSLVQGNDYRVIGIYLNYYRIIDEAGEPSLYPKDYFVDCVLEPPEYWIRQDWGDGEYSWTPPEFSQRGFFEKYEDDYEAEVRTFKEYEKNNRRPVQLL